jgi:hypothetical protein
MNDGTDDSLSDYRRRMQERWQQENQETEPSAPIQEQIEEIPVVVIDEDEEEEIESVNISQLQDDEEYARKLQEEYYREYNETLDQQDRSSSTVASHQEAYETIEPGEEQRVDQLIPQQRNPMTSFPMMFSQMPQNSQFVSTRTVTRNGNTVTQTTRNIPGSNQVVTETQTGTSGNDPFGDFFQNQDPFSAFDQQFQAMRQRMFGQMGNMGFRRMYAPNDPRLH